jgi:hypothetical protein
MLKKYILVLFTLVATQYSYAQPEINYTIIQVWDDENYIDDSKNVYTYYNDGNVKSITQQYLESGIWKDHYRYIYVYDNSTGLLSLESSQQWDDEKNEWHNGVQAIYTYNSLGNVIQNENESWDLTTTTWKKAIKIVYSYDVNDFLIEEVTQQWNTEISDFENWTKTEYTNDLSGKVASYERTLWKEGAWENELRQRNNYTGENLTSTLFDYWDAEYSSWINRAQELYIYNSTGILTEKIYQPWDNNINAYKNRYRNLYNVDEDGYIIERLYQFYGTTDWDNNQSSRTTYYYSNTPTSLIKGEVLNLKVYPNPVVDYLTIDGAVSESPMSLYLYNSTGQEKLRVVKSEQTANIDFSSFPAGSYFLRVENGGKETTIQIIK